MSVKIANLPPTFSLPVTLLLPGEHGGFFAHKFAAIFARLKTSQIADYSKRVEAGGLTIWELLDATMVGWGPVKDEAGNDIPGSGIKGEDGSDAPYSHEARKAMNEDYPGTEQAIVTVFWDSMQLTQREAAGKNSGAPSAAS